MRRLECAAGRAPCCTGATSTYPRAVSIMQCCSCQLSIADIYCVSWQRAWVQHGQLPVHCQCTSSGLSSCNKCSLWSVCADPQSAPSDLRTVPLLAAAPAPSVHAPRPGQVVPTLAETLSWIRQRARQQPALRLQVSHIFLVALQCDMELSLSGVLSSASCCAGAGNWLALPGRRRAAIAWKSSNINLV